VEDEEEEEAAVVVVFATLWDSELWMQAKMASSVGI
jgi:hypothetical protein